MLNRFVYNVSELMAGFLDFALGAFVAVLLAYAFGFQPGLWQAFWGGVLMLWPDILSKLCGTHGFDGHHQSWTHHPIPVILGTTLLFAIIGKWYWAVVAFVCVTAHFIHDTRPLNSDGVAWLAPWRSDFLSLWGWEKPRSTPHDRWLREYWQQPSWTSCIELSSGAAALCGVEALLGYGDPLLMSATLLALFAGTFLLWSAALHVRLHPQHTS